MPNGYGEVEVKRENYVFMELGVSCCVGRKPVEPTVVAVNGQTGRHFERLKEIGVVESR